MHLSVRASVFRHLQQIHPPAAQAHEQAGKGAYDGEDPQIGRVSALKYKSAPSSRVLVAKTIKHAAYFVFMLPI